MCGNSAVGAMMASDGRPRACTRSEMKATPKAKRLVSWWLSTPEPHVRDLRSRLLLKIRLLRRRGRSPVALLTAQPDALVRRWRWTMTDAAQPFVEEALEHEQGVDAADLAR